MGRNLSIFNKRAHKRKELTHGSDLTQHLNTGTNDSKHKPGAERCIRGTGRGLWEM